MSQTKSYKEDSTKGRARIMPVNYKGDIIVQAWLDARKLLVLSRWLDKGGYNTQNISNIVKFTLDEVVEQLVSNGIEQKVEYTTDARELLKAKYNRNLDQSGRGRRNYLHNIHLDEIRRSNAWKDERGMIPSNNTPEAKARKQSAEDLDKVREIEEEAIDERPRELTGQARIDCKIESDSWMAKARENELTKPYVRVGDDSQVMDQYGTFDPNNPEDVAMRKEIKDKAYVDRKAEIAESMKEEAEVKEKLKEEKKAKKAEKKEKAELEALRIEYEEKKKAFEGVEKADDRGGDYKPKSDEEVAEDMRKIEEDDKALYATDMSGA